MDVSGFVNKVQHSVFVGAPSVGCRATCLVINQSIRHCIVPDSLVTRPRAISIVLHWEGYNVRIVSAHLAACHSRASYMQSIDDMNDIINNATDSTRKLLKNSRIASPELVRTPVYNIVGVDAQVSVGVPRTREEARYIGQAVEDVALRTWKAKRFITFMRS